MSEDRIKFEEIRENVHGNLLGWIAKGHVDMEDFCKIINASEGLTPGNVRHLVPTMVRHVYTRRVKSSEVEDGRKIIECQGPRQGAVAVTIGYLPTRQSNERRFCVSFRREGPRVLFTQMISYDGGHTWANFGKGSLGEDDWKIYADHALSWADELIDVDERLARRAMPLETT